MACSAHMDMLDENIESFRGWESIVWHGFHLEDWRRHGVINRVAYFEVINLITFCLCFPPHRYSVLNGNNEYIAAVNELLFVSHMSP